MSTHFPASQDTFPRPAPGDARLGHAQLHNDLADAVEALEAAIGTPDVADPTCLSARVAAVEGVAGSLGGAALLEVGTTAGTVAAGDDSRFAAETAATIGALIAGATDKSTPVDADLVGLSDSAASGSLKKCSWDSLKAALNGIFARLAGVSGGQTLIGGTGANDALALQGSAASGTSGSNKALRLLSGDAGATEALTVLNNGNVGIGQTAPAHALQIGSGATTLAADGAGNLASGGTPGTVETTTGVYTPTALAATASSTANVGTAGINAVAGRMTGNPSTGTSSVYRGIYGYAEVPAANTYGWGGSVRAGQFEVRCKGSGSPIGAQLGCFATAYLESAVTMTTNVALQGQAYNNAAGGTISSNIALYGIASNSAAGAVTDNQGVSALARNNSSGTITTNIGGKYTASKTSSGSITTNLGVAIACTNASAAGSITDCIGLAIGGAAVPWSNSGTITNATALLIGSSTNVGTNKKAIHSDSAAPSYLAGGLAIGLDAASAKLHSVATTEQLRLGYDATKYASFTVDSSGTLKIAAPLILTPPASMTPATNGDLTVEATSNTSLTFRLKGSDGVVRSASLTLA